ncbi:MAG TPA: XdhC family protein [Thermoleophilaceae bacterium]|jgi:xanthine dehydrogenase accessory factor
MMRPDLARRADALLAERTPFVVATVVRAQHPTSVRPGDSGIVLGDGTIEGFVGGACAETSVRLQALRALETGEALLLRIVPEGDETAEAEGALVVQNPCLSGGALEIFLEPRLPAPRIAVVGETPIGHALVSIGDRLGYDVVLTPGAPEDTSDDVALVVASHGREEEDALASGLAAGIPYVGLVASRKRGAAVIEELATRGVPADRLKRLHTPAGLDIGAKTAEEIGLSILAEIVSTRTEHVTAAAATSAVDPVCGMTVAVSESSITAQHEGRSVYFCGDGCRQAFESDPARYAASLG